MVGCVVTFTWKESINIIMSPSGVFDESSLFLKEWVCGWVWCFI